MDRIIVRIDNWDTDSSYPNGHFVRSLGKIGDLEAEVAAILVENDLRVPPFSEAQVRYGISSQLHIYSIHRMIFFSVF